MNKIKLNEILLGLLLQGNKIICDVLTADARATESDTTEATDLVQKDIMFLSYIKHYICFY
jgi:hypothetical protein